LQNDLKFQIANGPSEDLSGGEVAVGEDQGCKLLTLQVRSPQLAVNEVFLSIMRIF
jgi:hypothetical protein